MTLDTSPSDKRVHYARGKNLAARMPMCGYCPDGDGISDDAARCNCVECLDWIRPTHDVIRLLNQAPEDQPFPGEHAGEGKL